MEFETLGGKEVTKEKGIFLGFCLLLGIIMIDACIGAPLNTQMVMYFYIMLLTFSCVWIVLDIKMPDRDLDYIDTVTIEDESPIPLKYQLVAGVVISLIMGFFMATSGQSFLKALPFGITFGSNWATPAGSGTIAAVVGMVEVLFFFCVVYPSLHSTIFKSTDSTILAIVLALFGISLGFMAFHFIAYGYSQQSLLTIFIFGLVFQAVPILLTRSAILSLFLHASNNFFVTIFVLSQIVILLIA